MADEDAWDEEAYQKHMAKRLNTGAGAKDIGAGLAGTEHFANQLVFGTTPALQEARAASKDIGTNANPMAGFGDWIGKKFGLESTPSAPPEPPAAPPPAPAGPPDPAAALAAGGGEFGDTSGTGNVSGEQIKDELKTSEAQHPVAATVGKAAAELAHQAAMAPLMPFARGGTLLKAVGNQAVSGAVEGGLQGAGSAIGEGKPMDTDTLLGILGNAGLGGLTGGIGGGIGHGIARVAQPGLSRVGTLGQGIADDVKAAFGAGAPTLEKAGAKALPAEAAQVGGMLTNNPAQKGAAQKLASEVETLATRSGQVPELTAEKGVQQGKVGAQQAAQEAQLASSTARAAPTLNSNISPKVLTKNPIGRVADNARASVAAGLGKDVGKDSPAAWIATRELLENQLESASATQTSQINGALKRIDKLLKVAAPDAAKTVTQGKTVAATGKVADIVNKPLGVEAAAPAKKLGDMTIGDLATKFGTSAIGALGAGIGHGSIEGAVLGGLAPAAAQLVYKAAKTLGTKGAIQLYMKDPAKFMAQYGQATAINRPLGMLGRQAVKAAAPLAAQSPALQNFMPYSP